MLPIQLKLKGIYSYQEEQVINFEQLIQDRLFGIFGEVGSGKSTILEAVTLALYNETERLSKSNRGYNLMNLRSKELMVDFEFKAGREQTHYRFTIQGKRNSKRFEDVKTFVHSRYEWNEAKKDWIPTEKTAEEIIHLSYENFKRTIIIPQGKFQDFLQLKDAKRAEMMEEIFQLEKFNLQGNVGQLKKENEKALNHLDGQMSGMELISKEGLKEKKDNVAVLEKAIDKEQQTHDKQQTQLQAMNNLREDFINWEKRKESFKDLTAQKADYQKREKWMNQCLRCQSLFHDIVSEMRIVKNEGSKLKTANEKLLADKKATEQSIKEKEKSFLTLKEKYPTIDLLEKKLKDLATVLKMKTLKDTFEQQEKKLVELKKNIGTEEKELIELKKQLQEKTVQLQLLQSAKDVQDLIELMSNQNKELEAEIKKNENQKKDLAKSIKALVGKDWNEVDLLDDLIEATAKKQPQLKTDFLQLQELLRAEKGHDCLLEYLLKTFTLQSDQLTTLKQRESFTAQSLEGNPAETAKALNKEIEQINKKILSKEAENKQEKLNELLQSIQKGKTEFEYLKESFGDIDVSGLLGKSIKEINGYQDLLTKDKAQYEAQEKTMETLQQKAKELVLLQKDRSKQIKKNQEEYDVLMKNFKQKILETGYEDIEAVRKFLKPSMDDLLIEQKEINGFNQKLGNEEAIIQQLEKKLQNKKYDQHLHEELQEQFKVLQTALANRKKEKNVLDEDIVRLTKLLKEKQALAKEKKRLEVRQANIKALESLFRAKGFVNYVSGIKLKDLCNAANARFHRMTKNHLSLELTDKNSFQIRDYMNGGQVRGISTLSGGQTFQAALCLAIALADIVNQHKGQQADFFFLDEGFGSLDKNSLQIVFETLQSLRKENKIVGVISHVEELQEEIGTYLKITNTEKGSRVKGNWAF